MALTDFSVDKIETKHGMEHPPVPAPDRLPPHAFSMMITAPKGSGKTTLLCNLLNKFYKGYFHDIFIMSPTVLNDEKWEVIKKTKGILGVNKKLKKLKREVNKNKNTVIAKNPRLQEDESSDDEDEDFDGTLPEDAFISDDYEEHLRNILAEQDKQNLWVREHIDDPEDSKYYIDRVLIIFDDMVGSDLFHLGKNNMYKRLCVRHRHWNVSHIAVTQAYKEVPKTPRVNAYSHVVFDIPNQKELETIYEENPSGMKKEAFMALHKEAVSEPFGFMFIDYYKPREQRIMKNFDEFMEILETEPDPQGEEKHARAQDSLRAPAQSPLKPPPRDSSLRASSSAQRAPPASGKVQKPRQRPRRNVKRKAPGCLSLLSSTAHGHASWSRPPSLQVSHPPSLTGRPVAPEVVVRGPRR